MSRTVFAVIWCLGSLFCGRAVAAPFTDKTIDIGWVSAGSSRLVSDCATVRFNNTHQYTIFVSSAGRVFMRRSFTSLGRGGGSDRAEIGPEQRSRNASIRFAGNTLVGTAVQPSGAVQFVVSFDAGYTACNLHVTYGRAGAARLVTRGPDGSSYEIDVIQALQPTCRITDGNGL